MRALALLALTACLSKPGPPGGGDHPDGGGGPDGPPPSGGFGKLAVGDNHACAIDAMQRLYCWGSAELGQLGNLTASTGTPTMISPDSGWTDIAAGSYHTCGILDGKVRCWGDNSVDETAHGTIFDDLDLGSFVPVAIFARNGGSCALDADGKLMCWGEPAVDALEPSPVVVGGNPDLHVATLALGGDHACALTTDGTAYCWGANASNQLGTAASGPVAPESAQPIAGVQFSAIAVGGYTTCGIRKETGAIECWGDLTAPMTPNGMPVVDQTRAWTAIAMGFDFMCGVAGGDLRCWGYGQFGQTAAGFVDQQGVPASAALSDVAALGVGDDFGCARTADNRVACWGQNRYGNVGNGQIARALQPVTVFDDPTFAVRYATVGFDHACFSLENGNAYCWGDNRNHQVAPADGTKLVTAPTLLAGKMLGQLSAGAQHTCGLELLTGYALCWGKNDDGELGTAQSVTSFEVQKDFDWISAGEYGTCGISGGDVWCWGMVPGIAGAAVAKVPLPMKAWKQVMVGADHVLVTDGSAVYAWGDSCAATGGAGDAIPASAAVQVTLPAGAPGVELAVSTTDGSDSCALLGADQLYCWGKNEQNELAQADGCTAPFHRTATNAQLGGVDPSHPGGVLTMWGDHGCTLTTNADALCWGDDNERELGTRADDKRAVDLLIPFDHAYYQVAVGPTIGCATRANDGSPQAGSIECWGTSPYGELGNGTTFAGKPTPVVP